MRPIVLLFAPVLLAACAFEGSESAALVGSSRIVITASMVSNDPTRPALGNYQALYDEQDRIGDPRAGAGAAATTAWINQSYRDADYPMGFVIDLGAEHDLSDIALYDAEGIDTVTMEIGAPGAWTSLATYTTGRYLEWVVLPVEGRTRYLRFLRGEQAGLREIAIYGSPVIASGAPAKIPLDASMLRVDAVRGATGNYAAIVDEQVRAGNPVLGTAGAPITMWNNQSWRASDYPAGLYVDLGQSYVVTHVAYYDTTGIDSVGFDVGEPGAWSRVVDDVSGRYLEWRTFEVGEVSRYVHFTRGMQAGVGEILIYGYPASGEIDMPPVVSAGADQAITAASATLRGMASDADGSIVSMLWTQTSGPSTALFSAATALTTNVSGLVVGTYRFTLTATDDDGLSTSSSTNVVVSAAPVGRGTTTERYASTSTPGGYGYVEYLPAGYSARTDWPIVFFLHGAGERGNGAAGQLGRVRGNGPQRYIDQEGRDYPFVLISAQTGGDWSGYEMLHSYDAFLSHIVSTYRVDPRRVYLTGLSLGGSGTFAYAQQFPQKLAAILPVCPGAWSANDADAVRMISSNLAVWASHSVNDGVIPILATTQWIDALGRARGVPSSNVMASFPTSGETHTASIRGTAWTWASGQSALDSTGAAPSYPLLFTVHRTGNHGIWDRAYRDANVWTWLLAQRRP